jgi:hypothetical protein
MLYLCIPKLGRPSRHPKKARRHMKSKISIDMDWDNQPIIRIEYNESDDVRDKMVKRFMETFAGDSYFATFFFDNSISEMTEKVNRKATIRPLKPSQLGQHWEAMRDSQRSEASQSCN